MSEIRCETRCYPKLVITSPLIHYVVHRLSNSSNDIKSRWINRKPTWTSFYRPLLNHNITKQLHDDFFSKKEVAIPRTMIVWSCLSQSSHYTVWVLPVNEESWNQRISMLMWYMVPWNATKELYNGGCSLEFVVSYVNWQRSFLFPNSIVHPQLIIHIHKHTGNVP